MQQIPAPGFLAARTDIDLGPWTVMSGYGYPFSDLIHRTALLPTGKSAWSETVRARELIRCQFSPPDLNAAARDIWYPEVVVRLSEEIRINYLTVKAEYNLGNLRDGAEQFHGRRVTEDGSWEEAVAFTCCLSMSPRAEEFISVLPTEWAEHLHVLLRAIKSARKNHLNSIAVTTKHGNEIPRGFLKGVELFGPIVMRCLNYEHLSDIEAGTPDGAAALSESDLLAAAPFAEMRLEVLPMRPSPGVALGRASASSNVGMHVTHPERMLTDQHRRVFGAPSPAAGGVVVIDLSTSFDVSSADLDAILQVAPGATVIGYSHDPNWLSPVPKQANAWVLATNGHRCDIVPLSDMEIGHGGNGVDGPVLRHAVSLRRGNEPVVWITDGVVSDYLDNVSAACSREVLGLLRQHSIHVAESMSDGVQLVADLAAGRSVERHEPKPLIHYAMGR